MSYEENSDKKTRAQNLPCIQDLLVLNILPHTSARQSNGTALQITIHFRNNGVDKSYTVWSENNVVCVCENHYCLVCYLLA